jgi:hypothetical protein
MRKAPRTLGVCHFHRRHSHAKLLIGIRACVFDAYGTLFDFASALSHAARTSQPSGAMRCTRDRATNN